jgi:hypothetical protein
MAKVKKKYLRDKKDIIKSLVNDDRYLVLSYWKPQRLKGI